jgi:hypothetical protein
MPLCHFAFGSLHRAGKLVEQTDSFLEHILLPKKLHSFVCPEFMPIINSPNALVANPDSARAIEGGGVTFDEWVPAPTVGLLPNDVWMISFVDVPLRKLRQWRPSEHYGKLGIAFTDKFRQRTGAQRVTYYEYPNLARDPFVIELNQAILKNDVKERERLAKMVVERRKPAKLWPEVNGLFAVLKLTAGHSGQTTIEKLTYSRYEEGYDFEVEQEARIVTKEQDRDVTFPEADVLSIIVPNPETKSRIESELGSAWSKVPPVIEYPS